MNFCQNCRGKIIIISHYITEKALQVDIHIPFSNTAQIKSSINIQVTATADGLNSTKAYNAYHSGNALFFCPQVVGLNK
jgi:hypothetical protein